MAFATVRKKKSVPKTTELIKYQHGSINQVHIYLLKEITSTCTYGSYK